MDITNKLPPSPFGKAAPAKQTELELIKGELKIITNPNGKLYGLPRVPWTRS
jgi:hypothetical protein